MNDKLARQIGMRSMLKDIVFEWTQTSTSHGLPNIFRTNSIIRKIIWIICFAVSTIYCMYSVSIAIKSFMEYKTLITTQIIQEVPTNFPAVTICNLQFANKTSAQMYINNILYVNKTPIFKLSDYGDDTYSFIADQLQYIQSTVQSDKNLTLADMRRLGFEFSDMLLTCSFNYGTCTEDDFTFFYHANYGNCFTFNKGISNNGSVRDIKQVSLQGADYGLTIDLFVGDPNIQNNYEYGDDGMIVVVHNQSTVPLLNGDRILVATGGETDIKVNRNFISKLDNPYSDCLKDTSESSTFSSEYLTFINSKGIKYTQSYCYVLCLQNKIIKNCGCSYAWLPAYKSTACLTQTERDCIDNTIESFNDKGSTADCMAACPLECEFIEYVVSTSRATFPSIYLKKLFMNHSKIIASGISFNDLDKAILRLNVFYENMRYTMSEEVEAINTETFLSNIGGTLGLYLGISFLSLIEVVELVLTIIQTLIEFRLRKTQIVSNNFANDIKIEDVNNQIQNEVAITMSTESKEQLMI